MILLLVCCVFLLVLFFWLKHRFNNKLPIADIVNFIPDGFYFWPDQVYNEVNGKTIINNGYCSKKLSLLLMLSDKQEDDFYQILDIFRPDQKEKLISNIVALASNKIKYFHQNIVVENDQVLINNKKFVITGEKIILTNNKIINIIWVRDITIYSNNIADLNSQITILTKEKQQLSSIVDSIDDPICLQNEQDKKITFINKAFTNNFLYKSSNQSLESKFDSNNIAMANNFSDNIVKYNALDGKLENLANLVAENSFYLPDKQIYKAIIDGKRHFLVLNTKQIDDQVMKLFTDITALHECEEKLTKEIKSNKNILDFIPISICIFDDLTRLIYFNKEAEKLFNLSIVDKEKKYNEFLDKLRDARLLPEVSNYPQFKRKELDYFTSVFDIKDELIYLADNSILRRIIVLRPYGGLVIIHQNCTDSQKQINDHKVQNK